MAVSLKMEKEVHITRRPVVYVDGLAVGRIIRTQFDSDDHPNPPVFWGHQIYSDGAPARPDKVNGTFATRREAVADLVARYGDGGK